MHIHPAQNRKRERGFVTLIWTCMMLFIIVPVVGLAIDAGVMYVIKSKLQTATDGAALGAARSLSRGQDIPSQQASATDTAVRYFHANFPNNWMGVTPVADPTVTWPAAPPATAIINVQGDVNAPTWFMRIIGVNSLHFTVVGQATRRNVNLLLVLDRSTSLS
jgi:Flp pilus assembly protein TadG